MASSGARDERVEATASANAEEPTKEETTSLPAEDIIGCRSQLRGLWEPLLRMDREVRRGSQRLSHLPSESWEQLFQGFLPTADPDLHYALRSFLDGSAVEAHAEQILDVFCRLASDAEWRKWLRLAVQVAAYAGNLSVFDRLLAACPRDSTFWTQHTARKCFYGAVVGGNFALFSSLRDVCPANPELLANIPALHLLLRAAWGGNMDIFSNVYALYRDRSEFWTDEENMWQLLGGAAYGGNFEILSTVLALSPSAEVWTPGKVFRLLGRAVSGGSFEMFLNVLAIDGFPSLSDVDYNRGNIRMLLEDTARGGSVDILLALLEVDGFGAEVRDVGESDERPFSALYAAARCGHSGVVAALIEAGAPLEYRWCVQGCAGDTALSAAVSRGHKKVVRELLASGASISNTRETFMTPGQNLLSVAAYENNEGTIDDLVAAGADLGKDRVDGLPLHVAAKKGFCRPLERLLLAGAKVDCVDRVGRSALHVACFYNREGAVEMLLRHHASTSLLCDDGRSPCDMVAADALESRQKRTMRSRFNPCTLNVVETAVADRIYGMLRSASRWARWGWLVMMRARYLGTEQVHGASTSLLSLSGTLCKGSQIASLLDGSASENIDHDCSTPTAGWSMSAAADAMPNCETSPGVHCQEPKKSAVPSMVTGARGYGWKSAVVWLLQCPDECGVFREVLSFL
ncbi:unnamed protein product [Ectocarpus sp. 4 AP-2014]